VDEGDGRKQPSLGTPRAGRGYLTKEHRTNKDLGSKNFPPGGGGEKHEEKRERAIKKR